MCCCLSSTRCKHIKAFVVNLVLHSCHNFIDPIASPIIGIDMQILDFYHCHFISRIYICQLFSQCQKFICQITVSIDVVILKIYIEKFSFLHQYIYSIQDMNGFSVLSGVISHNKYIWRLPVYTQNEIVYILYSINKLYPGMNCSKKMQNYK